MKIKNLWIPFVILTLIGGTAKICDTVFNVNGDGFVLNSYLCNLIFSVSVLLLLFIGWGLSIADRKKAISVAPSKNFMCGVFGFIASVAIISIGIVSLISDTSNLVNCILALVGGSVLLFESCISFTGQNGMAKIPVVSLFVPIWCCSRFITVFSQYTQRSIRSTEMFDIIAVAFLLMFLFYQSMFFAGINNSVSVRKSTVYGTVFIMLGLVVSADLLIKMSSTPVVVDGIDTQVVEPTVTNILSCVCDIAMCGYAFLFIRDNIKNANKSLDTLPTEAFSETISETDEETVQTPETSENTDENSINESYNEIIDEFEEKEEKDTPKTSENEQQTDDSKADENEESPSSEK